MDLTNYSEIQNYINGKFIKPLHNQYLNNINPATNTQIGTLPNSTSDDVELAVAAAQKAFPIWSTTTLENRFNYLHKIAELIESNIEALALAETTDNGKPLWLSKKVDIPRAASNFRFFASALLHFSSQSHTASTQSINYTTRTPIGVVGCISPWNLPLYLFTWKIAPALATGNCVIAKPSEVTPLTAFLLSKICAEAKLPPGVLNIIHGSGEQCGKAIVAHPAIKAISFTGSTRAGEDIARIASPMFKKISLELGGKNPALIFADCNWEKMIKTTVQSSFSNQGQICLCSSRVLIEKSIYEKFKTDFIAQVKKLYVGDPLEENTKVGAIVSELHYHKIMNCIEIATQNGGIILHGGEAIKVAGRCENGFFIEPTIIENLPATCSTNMEEIFGPVVTLQSFETYEEAIALANTANYGLAATVWTQDVNKAHRTAAALQCGIVWINCWLNRDLRTPFGGTKNSGVGREGGWESMRFFTEPKNICIDAS